MRTGYRYSRNRALANYYSDVRNVANFMKYGGVEYDNAGRRVVSGPSAAEELNLPRGTDPAEEARRLRAAGLNVPDPVAPPGPPRMQYGNQQFPKIGMGERLSGMLPSNKWARRGLIGAGAVAGIGGLGAAGYGAYRMLGGGRQQPTYPEQY